MPSPYLVVAGKHVGFDRAWVHLKGWPTDSSPYTVVVPLSVVPAIFDPHGTKPDEVAWADFVRSMVADLGTFILDGYFQRLWKHSTVRERRFDWVIATLDEVREDSDSLFLTGRAEPFRPDQFG